MNKYMWVLFDITSITLYDNYPTQSLKFAPNDVGLFLEKSKRISTNVGKQINTCIRSLFLISESRPIKCDSYGTQFIYERS